MHADILRVTRAIEERSKDLRDDYLNDVDAMRLGAPDRKQLSCGNLAHGMAVLRKCSPCSEFRCT